MTLDISNKSRHDPIKLLIHRILTQNSTIYKHNYP